MAIVNLQLNKLETTSRILSAIVVSDLAQRAYLYYALTAEYFIKINEKLKATSYLEKAIQSTSNMLEKEYLIKRSAMLKNI